MKKTFFFFVVMAIFVIISASNPAKNDSGKDKDKVIRELVKLISDRRACDQIRIREVRKTLAYVTFNMDKDTCMTSEMRKHIMATDSSFKNVTDGMDFTEDQLNNFYEKNGIENPKNFKQ